MGSHQSAYEGSEEMPMKNGKYNAWSEGGEITLQHGKEPQRDRKAS
jgi:hypothetical protein